MILRLIAITALVLILAVDPPGAASAACTSRMDVVAFLAKNFPEARVTAFGGDEAKTLLASLGAATGVTPPTADTVDVVDLHPSLPIMKVVVFRSGCLVGVGTFQRRLVTSAINTLAKAGA